MAREPDTKEDHREDHRQTVEHRLAALEAHVKAVEAHDKRLETLEKHQAAAVKDDTDRLAGLETVVRRLAENASHPAPVADDRITALEARFQAMLEKIGWA